MIRRLEGEFQRAARGDLQHIPLMLSRGVSGPSERAWAVAGKMLWWFAQPRRTSRVRLPEIESLDGPGAIEAAILVARAAFLELDLPALRAAQRYLLSISVPHGRLLDGQLAFFAGDGASAVTLADEVAKAARENESPQLRVDAVLLRGMGQMAAGEIKDATSTARRAARMAQTEHLWLPHFMASLILARLRRLGGRPHLAGMISSACLSAASPVFAGWLRWELMFSGTLPTKDEERGNAQPSLALAAADHLEAFLRNPADADLLRGARDCVETSASHLADVAALEAAVGVLGTPTSPSVTRWISGEQNEVPPVLSGLAPPSWHETSEAAVVIGVPKGRSQRVLGFTLPVDHSLLAPHGAQAARPEALAAALCLAGESGLARADLFERVYGFKFRKRMHEPTFKVVRSQARKLLSEVAEVDGDAERLQLRVVQPFSVVDPRCQKPFSEVLLRFLATAKGASAKNLSERLGVSIRTVQHALREMTEDGACVAEKAGRRVGYAVEDTTFCAITVA